MPRATVLSRLTRCVVLALLLVSTLWRSPLPVQPVALSLGFVPLRLPVPERLAAHLGAFRLEKAWWLQSPTRGFGSYSALLLRPGGHMLAISDAGGFLTLARPGESQTRDRIGQFSLGNALDKSGRDVESATQAPDGTYWLGLEGLNAIYRMNRQGRIVASVQPASMKDWARNSGPEAMARLQNGRFAVLGEGFVSGSDHLHPALLFPTDPTTNPSPVRFVFDGPATFSPTDMAQLPDGRLLILMRTLIWPMPQRFAGRIVIGDPETIREGHVWYVHDVAHLASDLDVDNFEGLALEPAPDGGLPDGRLTVWLISDDNYSSRQRTLLWQLSVDPAHLPR